MNTPTKTNEAPVARLLRRLFCGLVVCLALYQFSENTTDPDLWAHTMLGRDVIKTGHVVKEETLSWTVRGLPLINHEVMSEVSLGAAHLIAGGTGILLLKILVGMVTLGISLRLGAEKLEWPQRAVAWAIAGIAVVEISYGFPPRPQIFTALFLATELWLLRRVQEGKPWMAVILPELAVVWMNFHGGVLAGLGVLFITAVASTGQMILNKQAAPLWNAAPVSKKAVMMLWIVAPLCVGAIFINPWGAGLVRWIWEASFWPRPQIAEWNPVTLSWDHAVFFILVGVAAVSFGLSRRPRNFWEIAVCAALALQAFRAVRHTPLFCIAAVAFVPPHLADVLVRFRANFVRIEELFSQRPTQKALCVVMGLLSAGILVGTFTLHKQHPLTMEVPANRYPLAAVEFIRSHDLRGNTVSFFDWGEMCLWELPECPPSLDGRMDNCYPHEFIRNHWEFYKGNPYDWKMLDVSKADLALLPVDLPGTASLLKEPGWKLAYMDKLAAVLVRVPSRFAKLPVHLPVEGDPGALAGSVRFPDGPPKKLFGAGATN